MWKWCIRSFFFYPPSLLNTAELIHPNKCLSDTRCTALWLRAEKHKTTTRLLLDKKVSPTPIQLQRGHQHRSWKTRAWLWKYPPPCDNDASPSQQELRNRLPVRGFTKTCICGEGGSTEFLSSFLFLIWDSIRKALHDLQLKKNKNKTYLHHTMWNAFGKFCFCMKTANISTPFSNWLPLRKPHLWASFSCRLSRRKL